MLRTAADAAGVVAQPQVDSSNAMASLAQLMGPTPAEREAQERRMLQNKAQMAAWTGLFDGLRQLGNLYFTAKGASPQKTESMMPLVEQNYQQQRQMYNDMASYRRQYAQGLYTLRRQMEEDARKTKLNDAQANYYNSRDELAQQRIELDKLKAVRVIKQKDGSLMKFDPVSGTIDPLTEADPLYQEYMRSQINRNNRTGTGKSGSGSTSTYGYRTVKHVDPATGDVITERIPTTPNQPQGQEKPTTKVAKPKPAPKQKPNKNAGNKRGTQNKKNNGKTKVNW